MCNQDLKDKKWALLPTYLGRITAMLRIGNIPHEIEEEWLVVVVLSEIK